MSTHALFSPSASSRWLNCHGSVNTDPSDRKPDTGSAAATFGTECHEAAAQILEGGVKFDKATENLADDQCEIIGDYVDFIYGLVDDLEKDGDVETWIETTFTHTLRSDYGGTTDFGAYSFHDSRLTIVDLKTGWVPVKLRDRADKINSQLGSYALLLAVNIPYEVKVIDLWVVQPRVHFKPLKITITVDELRDFEDRVLTAIDAIEKGDTYRHAGEHCKYCPVSGNCKEQRNFANEMARKDFMLPQETYAFTDREISDVLSEVEALEIYIQSVREHAQLRIMRGATVPDWKLVERRAVAKWLDPEKVKRLCALEGLDDNDVYRRTLRTPKQISEALEKAGSWNDVAGLYEKRSSGYSLARNDDKRAGVSFHPSRDFGD